VKLRAVTERVEEEEEKALEGENGVVALVRVSRVR
jgi:hypothetical protein